MTAGGMRLDGVHLRYKGGPVVLAGVDLELEPGKPVLVVGSNGSGKSTLLRVAAGCSHPDAGSVLARPRSVGYVPDRFPSQLQMPAASYLWHMAALHRADPRAAAAQAAALAAELGFSGGLSTPMVKLSKGNTQKIALAQALCSGAALLVLDEPWSGLDPDAAPVLVERIAAAAADGAAVLVTDHTHTADGLPGRRLLRLHAGVLVEELDRVGSAAQAALTVRVTLRHRQAARLAARLRHACLVSIDGDQAILDVAPERSDALLHAALSWGASISSVHRIHNAGPTASSSRSQEARHNK